MSPNSKYKNRLNLKPTDSPVPGTTSTMRHREHLNGGFCDTINYTIGKTAEKIPSRTVRVLWPSLRSTLHLPDSAVELSYERVCHSDIAFRIPPVRCSRFCDGLGMKLNAWTSHAPAREFGAVQRTRERSLPLLYPDLQCGARSLDSTPPRRPRPLTHQGFQVGDSRAPHELQAADGGPLVEVFRVPDSSRGFYIRVSRQGKFSPEAEPGQTNQLSSRSDGKSWSVGVASAFANALRLWRERTGYSQFHPTSWQEQTE